MPHWIKRGVVGKINSQSKSFRRLNPALYPGEDTERIDCAPVASRKTERKAVEERLNKTEKRWLFELRARGLMVKPFGLTLLLANGVRFTPDFYCCISHRQPLFYEVKGAYVRPDAWTKLKMAASLFPEFTFIIAQWKDGAWTEMEIKP
jgi:hypothetical protein